MKKLLRRPLQLLATRCRSRRRFLRIALLVLGCPLLWLLGQRQLGGAIRGGAYLRWSIVAGQLPNFWLNSPTPRGQPSEAEQLARIRNGSVRCGEIQALFPHRIPPVVHWTNKDDRVIVRHQDLLRSWSRILGDSVAYMYWSDAAAEQLIRQHYPKVWQQYQRLAAGIMRSDIARLVLLHHIGGVYADLDVELRRSLHPLMLQYTALWSQEPTEHLYYMYKRARMLSNAIYLTKARHPFLEFVLTSWPAWFEANWSRQQFQLQDANQAVFITGPIMLNRFLDLYSNVTREPLVLAHPDTFQPTWDTWYVRMVSKRQCIMSQGGMPPEWRRHCELLRARDFQTRPVGNESFAVHWFLHTSYGGGNDYAKAKLAKDILPLSRCVI